jgi:hypothetical protein
MVVITCVFVLFGFFIGSVYFNTKAIKLETYYPDLDCSLIYKEYTLDQIKDSAGNEYFTTEYIKDHKDYVKTPKIGILPCFCKQ